MIHHRLLAVAVECDPYSAMPNEAFVSTHECHDSLGSHLSSAALDRVQIVGVNVWIDNIQKVRREASCVLHCAVSYNCASNPVAVFTDVSINAARTNHRHSAGIAEQWTRDSAGDLVC